MNNYINDSNKNNRKTSNIPFESRYTQKLQKEIRTSSREQMNPRQYPHSVNSDPDKIRACPGR